LIEEVVPLRAGDDDGVHQLRMPTRPARPTCGYSEQSARKLINRWNPLECTQCRSCSFSAARGPSW
jgi:hypothetical protein